MIASNNLLASIAAGCPDGLLYFDQSGHVRYANPAAERLFGARHGELLGRTFDDERWCLATSGGPYPQRNFGFLRVARTGEPAASLLHLCASRNGEKRLLSISAAPVSRPRGLIHDVVVSVRDVTTIERERCQQAGQEALSTLSRRIAAAHESERRLIARELHDGTGQDLAALRILISTLTESDPGTHSTALRLVDETLRHLREICLDLRPSLLDDFGLLPAILGFVDRFGTATGITVTLNHCGLEDRLPSEVETAAYRIVQEALTNLYRHACVSSAAVRLAVSGGSLFVQVEDAGRGFDPDMAAGGGGLDGMRARAALLAGFLTVDSRPGVGTRVTAELPLIEWAA